MTDMTPLPSPVLQASPLGWYTRSRPPSREFSISSTPDQVYNAGISSKTPRRKGYSGLSQSESAANQPHVDDHKSKSRSISQYVPDHAKHQETRVVSARLPDTHQLQSPSPPMSNLSLQRERNFAIERGIKLTIQKPPTPPSSSRGTESDDEGNSRQSSVSDSMIRPETYSAKLHSSSKIVHWRGLQLLGEGSFSKVYLAAEIDDRPGQQDLVSPVTDSPTSTRSTSSLRDPGLVAVKIIQHGPSGGASSDRIAVSTQREIEMLRKIRHPSLIHVVASSTEPDRTLLVMQYCAGGDLFTFASRQTMKSSTLADRSAGIRLTQRIFAELVGAVDHLHRNNIVHRDIKLENILLNITPPAVRSLIGSHRPNSLENYADPIITLTDMGLSKLIDPANPMQSTRCGSEDYAAPELLMGQPYDGRSTDCWALGVVLYALLEGRLPFDPPADKRSGALSDAERRRKTLHRIARIEWSWDKYYEDGDSEDEDGDEDRQDCAWGMDAEQTAEIRAAKEVVGRLLKRGRSRWLTKDLMANGWVKAGIPDSGLQFPTSVWDKGG